VIYPELHYGRDALAGIALFLSHLAKSKMKCSALRQLYPQYVIAKKKLTLAPDMDFIKIVGIVKNHYTDHLSDERDGLWIEHENGWVQIRKSNTEPVMRIYAEGRTNQEAEDLAESVISIVKNI
jgi:phosphomannomutase